MLQIVQVPLPSFNVRTLGKKVNFDDLFKLTGQIPYSEGVVEFGKRVTNNLSSTLGFTYPETNADSESNPSPTETQKNHPDPQKPPRPQ